MYKENMFIQFLYVVDSSKKSGEFDLLDEEILSFEGSGEKFLLFWQKSIMKLRRFK